MTAVADMSRIVVCPSPQSGIHFLIVFQKIAKWIN